MISLCKIGNAESCSELIFELLSFLQLAQINRMAMVVWGIRRRRNDKLWNNIQFSDQLVVRRIIYKQTKKMFYEFI